MLGILFAVSKGKWIGVINMFTTKTYLLLKWRILLLFVPLLISSCTPDGKKLKGSSEPVKLAVGIMLTDEYENKISLDSVVGNRPKLFLRIPPNCCSPCLNHEIQLLNEVTNKSIIDNTIILTSYENLRDLMVFKRNFSGFNFKCYNIGSEELGLDDQFLDVPYYFALKSSRSLEIKGIYKTGKEYSTESKDFIKLASKELFGLSDNPFE